MKVLLLSDANSVHTIKWIKGLTSKGITVCLWSLTAPKNGIYDSVENLTIETPAGEVDRNSYLTKFKYLLSFSHLKRTLKAFKPDILHAHYASSYGLLGSFMNFHPYIISVWGSDVYDFPNKNVFFRSILKWNLRKADNILSTSHVMAIETQKYTNKDIIVTPFGIDCNLFKSKEINNKQHFYIGTIKTLEEKYGIKYLIEAFSIFIKKYPNDNIKLLIVGGGSLYSEFKRLVSILGIGDYCVFTGGVPFEKVPYYHNMLDISVFPSILDSESFGVAVIEASATGKPVIVSNVGGLPEVVENGVTGIIVDAKRPEQIAEAIEKLYLSSELRLKLGQNGVERVKRLFNWEDNVMQMIDIYKSILQDRQTDNLTKRNKE